MLLRLLIWFTLELEVELYEDEEEAGGEYQAGVWYPSENEGAKGKLRRGKPGRVLERELAEAEPEKRDGKLDEDIEGTSGLEGAETGGEDKDDGGR